jgi:hypothetical protein
VAEPADQAGFGPAGTYSLSLQTQHSPYAMTVAFDHLDKPFDTVDLSADATLMPGLVANLDTVSVTSDGHCYSLTASDASTVLGYDVKKLGREQTDRDRSRSLARCAWARLGSRDPSTYGPAARVVAAVAAKGTGPM